MSDLSRFVKAYDVRGTVPDQLNTEVARAFGAAFVRVLRREAPVPTIVIAYDMRPSSPELADAFADGGQLEAPQRHRGRPRLTNLLYAAAGSLDLPGAMFTASHNPPSTTASSCAAPARSRSAWRPGWPTSATTGQAPGVAGPPWQLDG